MIHSIAQIKKAFGSFWRLHNRIKLGKSGGLLVLACSEMDFSGDELFERLESVILVQNPGGCCTGRWRKKVVESLSYGGSPLTDVVYLTHPDCRFCFDQNPEDHAINQIRALSTIEPLSQALSKRTITLHAWSVDPAGDLKVYCPVRHAFVSPLQL